MGLTTDPNDPDLTHGVDEGPVQQAKKYLILSEEERAKGFVRPVRRAYRHVGPPGPDHPLRELTPDEAERHGERYVRFEPYEGCTEHDHGSATGSLWTQARLDAVGNGCGTETLMGLELCETYARNPRFYGATLCVNCSRHLPVAEFVWVEDGERVGS